MEMMMSPNCPDHGRLVADLALGRLDDADALRAEELRESCADCRRWWQQQFSGEAHDRVDDVVASALAGLRLPARRRGHGWMALAAAVIMAFGATSLWLIQRPVQPGPVINDRDSTPIERVATIRTLDFESADDEMLVVHSAAEPAEEPVAERAVSHPPVVDVEPVALIAQTALPPPETTADKPEALFSGDFESGDLSDWGPST
jgi:hypothetical protein